MADSVLTLDDLQTLLDLARIGSLECPWSWAEDFTWTDDQVFSVLDRFERYVNTLREALTSANQIDDKTDINRAI